MAHGSMSEAARENAGCLRNMEGMEREGACGRQEAGGRRQEAEAGECVGAEVEHETLGVCRTGASFTCLQPTVGLSSVTQLMSLQTWT